MDTKQKKNIIKLFIAIYLISFLIINWNDVSWIFNYKEVYGLVSDFFNPYPTIEASSMAQYFYPNHSQEAGQMVAEVKTNYTDKENTLEIPKISISVPIIFSQSADKEALMKDLDQGVVYYPGSVYPGQKGEIVILGHSAPPNWPKIKHDWVFSELDKLEIGDSILVDVNNTQYTYIVKQKTIIKKGAAVPSDGSALKSALTLITCWPPGKDYERIAVRAEILN